MCAIACLVNIRYAEETFWYRICDESNLNIYSLAIEHISSAPARSAIVKNYKQTPTKKNINLNVYTGSHANKYIQIIYSPHHHHGVTGW